MTVRARWIKAARRMRDRDQNHSVSGAEASSLRHLTPLSLGAKRGNPTFLNFFPTAYLSASTLFRVEHDLHIASFSPPPRPKLKKKPLFGVVRGRTIPTPEDSKGGFRDAYAAIFHRSLMKRPESASSPRLSHRRRTNKKKKKRVRPLLPASSDVECVFFFPAGARGKGEKNRAVR